MKYSIVILCLLAGQTAFTQQWHSAGKKLRQPQKTSDYYKTVGYFNRYDSIPCTYLTNGSIQPQKGFKFVYVRHGHYIDDIHTFRVFYDQHFNKVDNVERFYFK